MLENTMLKPFDNHNLPLVVDVAFPLWSPRVGDSAFRRFYVEFIVRNNISENNYHFELVDSNSNEFLASAFFTRKGDSCKVEEWYQNESSEFLNDLLSSIDVNRKYLRMMDERTLSYMQKDDIKLSLFVSRKSGAGSILLKEICKKLKEEGWKNLFLWTDCECNWSWYSKHNFTLIQEDSYKPFCNESLDFKTYIFKKSL